MPALVQDPRLPVISFTGSEKVGYAIMDSVPRKHCTLELGGNGAAVVLADYASDADLDWAATRIATFSNYQGGQSCISVQRVIADASVYDRLLPRIVAAVEAQVTGDPADGATDVGPLVSEDAAKRVETWVEEAVRAGANLLAGGKRDGASYAPTVLTDVPADVTISCEEVFGPVLTVQKVDGETAAFAAANDSKYGLQAGVFTTTSRPPSAPTAPWRSAVSSSATCPPTAPTRCRTAAPSSPGSAVRASSSRWTTTRTSAFWCSPVSLSDLPRTGRNERS